MICEIWACVFGGRLSPLVNLLTDEAQTAYKPNRSTLDVLSQIENGAKQSKTNQLMLIDLANAIGFIERGILSPTLYETGTPRTYIRAQQPGHTGTQLRHKLDGQLGGEINNNKGVSQGIPLSAQLFAIYFNAALQEYDNASPGEIKQTQQETYERTEFGERKVTTHLWRCPNTNKKKHRPQPPRLYAKPESF